MPLRSMRPEEDRVAPYVFGRGPDYVVAGGLVFEELTRPYLGAWGDWARRAPPRLLVAIDREPDGSVTEPRRIVLVSSVLPDAANLGYQELRDLIVERVNGHEISTLADVRKALTEPVQGFQVVDFVPGQGYTRVVLDAAEAQAAAERLRQAYGVEKLDSTLP
jgi:hypothetical protein